MKPIEIHIEGYKIVISRDEEKLDDITVKEADEDMTIPYKSVPYKVYPSCPNDPRPLGWWERPNATWTNEDIFNTDTTSATPVRDFMVNGGIVMDMQEML